MKVVSAAILMGALSTSAGQDPPARNPVPGADVQKETIKLVKDLFKDEYARRAPEDQQALARKLLEKGLEEGADAASRFVLLQEARDLASASGDIESAFRAASELARRYEVDGPPMKLAALSKTLPLLRDPEKLRRAALAFQEVAREAVERDDYASATTAAGRAEAAARAAKDPTLAGRAQELAREVSALKIEHQRVQAAIADPGKGDREAVGCYLCFVRGDWEAGLKLLAEAGKPPVRDLASRDLSRPPDAESQARLGDGWWELAQKEKLVWKKSRLFARARGWYEQALSGSAGLAKIKVEKRLLEIEDALPGPVNLLRLVDPAKDAVHGTWSLEGRELLCPRADGAARVLIPYLPPEEYDLRAVVRRLNSHDAIVVGLVSGGAQWTLRVDSHPADGYLTGVELLDGKFQNQHAENAKGRRIENDREYALDVSVRKTGLTLAIDGKEVYAWKGTLTRLSLSSLWPMPDKRVLSVGGWGGGVAFREIRLNPVSGEGKKLR